MKMKLAEILTLNEDVKSIIDSGDTKINPLTKFKLLGIMKQLEPHVDSFKIIRDEKIREYGKEDEKTGSISISPEDKEVFQKYMDECNKAILRIYPKINIEKISIEDAFDKGIPADKLVRLYAIIS